MPCHRYYHPDWPAQPFLRQRRPLWLHSLLLPAYLLLWGGLLVLAALAIGLAWLLFFAVVSLILTGIGLPIFPTR